MTRRAEFFARMRARILRNCERIAGCDCLLWTGARNNKGYGVMSVRIPGVGHRKILAHRAAWEAFRERKMPRGRVGAHSYKCVSQACANWEHVRATTQSYNERDKKRAVQWFNRFRCDFPPTHTITTGRA